MPIGRKKYAEHKNTLENDLKYLESIEYECHGFPVFFLDYDYSITKKWSAAFRNPINFENPGIKADTPSEACQMMLDFLRGLKKCTSDGELEN